MISVREAATILESRRFTPDVCSVDINEAAGRLLREDIIADRCLPPFDRVAMDGFALSSAAIATGRVTFYVQRIQGAGEPGGTLAGDDRCIEIMTGAVLPHGCDTVVPIEKTARNGDTVTLAAHTKMKPCDNVHRMGSDTPAGAVLVRAGCVLNSTHIGILAAVGHTSVTVCRRPAIAVVSLGNELVDIRQTPEPFQIRQSNSYAMRTALLCGGFPAQETVHFTDDRLALRDGIRALAARNDIIILSGGISKGKFDHLQEVFNELGAKCHFATVAQKPGKPFWFGTLGPTKLFALPGNPVAALVCLHRYVVPYLRNSCGIPFSPEPVTIDFDFEPAKQLTYFLPVSCAPFSTPRAAASLVPVNGSGDFAALANSHGFVEISTPATRGDVLPFYRWA